MEIAERLGVKRNTVDQWRQRDLGFPEPRWTVGGRPAWNWDDIEAWATARHPVAVGVAAKRIASSTAGS